MITLNHVLMGFGFLTGLYLKFCGIGFTTSKFWAIFIPVMVVVYVACRSLGITW